MPVLRATIYHNIKCSKSNAALALLLEHGIETTVVNYLETPLSANQLDLVLNQLAMEAKQLIRFGESIAKDIAISNNDHRDNDEWLSLMSQHPILIERPIVVINNKAVIARPAERLLELLQTSQ